MIFVQENVERYPLTDVEIVLSEIPSASHTSFEKVWMTLRICALDEAPGSPQISTEETDGNRLPSASAELEGLRKDSTESLMERIACVYQLFPVVGMSGVRLSIVKEVVGYGEAKSLGWQNSLVVGLEGYVLEELNCAVIMTSLAFADM